MVLGRYAFGRLGPFKARLRRKSGGTGRFIRQKLRRDFAFRKEKSRISVISEKWHNKDYSPFF